MLGRFLEYSISTLDIRGSLAFYEKLGFSQAEVGGAWAYPYAVVTDGRVCLGLHETGATPTCLTFVKPNLLDTTGALEGLGIVLEVRHLSDDRFNEIAWLDTSGCLIRLVEARTFSPAKRRSSDSSACGYFTAVGLPAVDARAAKDAWERLGFVGMEELEAMLPHVACTSDTVNIGLYDPADLQQPTLLFEVDDLDRTAARLDAAGVSRVGRLPAALRGTGSMLLRAPEGTPILVSGADPA